MIVFDLIAHLISSQLNEHSPPIFGTDTGTKRSGPKPQPSHRAYGAPGHRYSMRPDLTRSGFGVVLGAYAPPVAVVALYSTAAAVEVVNVHHIASNENIPTSTKIQFLQGL